MFLNNLPPITPSFTTAPGASRLNILQIISGRSVNGALVYCKILSERLVELGHKVTIVCRPEAWIAANVDQNKIRVVESTMARFPPTEFRRIRSIVKQEKIDLIHSHMTRAQNYAIALKLFYWSSGGCNGAQ